MLVHATAPQRSPEWFAARLGRVTASEAASVIAKGRGNAESVTRRDYLMQLVVERLTGTVGQDAYTNAAMEHGTLYEPDARAAFQAVSGETVEESGFWYHDDRMVGASLDGHIRRGDREVAEIVEIKCPYKTVHHLTTLREGMVPPQYVAQVTHQLWVTGADRVHFVSFDPRLPAKLQVAWVQHERDEAAIQTYAAQVEAFLVEVEAEVAAWTAWGL